MTVRSATESKISNSVKPRISMVVNAPNQFVDRQNYSKYNREVSGRGVRLFLIGSANFEEHLCKRPRLAPRNNELHDRLRNTGVDSAIAHKTLLQRVPDLNVCSYMRIQSLKMMRLRCLPKRVECRQNRNAGAEQPAEDKAQARKFNLLQKALDPGEREKDIFADALGATMDKEKIDNRSKTKNGNRDRDKPV